MPRGIMDLRLAQSNGGHAEDRGWESGLGSFTKRHARLLTSS